MNHSKNKKSKLLLKFNIEGDDNYFYICQILYFIKKKSILKDTEFIFGILYK